MNRAGQVSPNPAKRPKSSYTRFEAEQPNETWQSDFTHYELTHPDGRPGADVEIISWLEDHSRYALHISAHRAISTTTVKATFRETAGQHGIPASTLTDNGMVSPSAWPAPAAAAASNSSYVPRTWSIRTHAPTTPPPAARSNASSRP